MKKLLSICFILLFLQLASADSVGASINVPDLNDSNLTTSYQPGTYYQGSTVKIIADYEDNASADLLGANVTVTISGVPHQMTYSASDSAYVYSHLFLTSGVYFMSVKAEVSGYDVQIKTVSVTILSSGGGGGGGSWYPPVTNDTINVTVNNFTGEFPAVEENESIIVNIDIYGNDFQTLLIIAADRITSGDIIITTEECANIQISSERVPYDCISVNLESRF